MNKSHFPWLTIAVLMCANTLVAFAAKSDSPLGGINNVTFANGVESWTMDISHRELLRDNFDETPNIDLNNLRFLYQRRDPKNGGNYSLLPYRRGLLRLEQDSR